MVRVQTRRQSHACDAPFQTTNKLKLLSNIIWYLDLVLNKYPSSYSVETSDVIEGGVVGGRGGGEYQPRKPVSL